MALFMSNWWGCSNIVASRACLSLSGVNGDSMSPRISSHLVARRLQFAGVSMVFSSLSRGSLKYWFRIVGKSRSSRFPKIS